MTADPWRRLAAAVLLQAVKDATGKGFKATPGDVTGAQEWLCSIEGQDLAAALDLENSLRRRLDPGKSWYGDGLKIRQLNHVE